MAQLFGHDGTWEGRLRHYLLPPLLIIDDFAMRDQTVAVLLAASS